MWRLFFPLKYFSLHNKEKSRIDLWPTLILAITFTIPYILVSRSNYFASSGFLDKIIPLSSALTAFYVAALVAVATFSHPDLDKEITLGAIYVVEKNDSGSPTKDYLTRRQFACIIFGYLAFLSMIISVLAAIAVTLNAPPLIISLPKSFGFSLQSAPKYTSWAITFLFNLGISHMMVVTGLGLYYLMERIHDRSPKVLTKKGAASKVLDSPPEKSKT